MIKTQTILPTPQDILSRFAPNLPNLNFVESQRQQIRQILEGVDPRILLIAGPCSVHDITAVKEYAIKLKKLAETLADAFLVVMRVYFEKPRTGHGWKGFLHDPWLNESDDIVSGIDLTRELLLDLTQMEIPIATEFLTPQCAPYFSDLIAWGCIGARTSASPTHRHLASGLPMPMAFKNSLDGNIEIAAYGAAVAAMPHTTIGSNSEGRNIIIKTEGNPCTHIVLRGGAQQGNYDPESINNALKFLEKMGQPQRLIIDCSHGNASRQYRKQIDVFQSITKQIAEGNTSIRGLILESHLLDGNQNLCENLSQLKYGLSITDPCLGWTSTEQLLKWGQKQLIEAIQQNCAVPT